MAKNRWWRLIMGCILISYIDLPGIIAEAIAQDNLGAVTTPSNVKSQWPSETDLCLDKDGCVCKKDLPKFPVATPKGVTLASVCEYNSRPEDNFLAGTFYFAGDVTVQGKIRLERQGGEEGAGDYAYFFGEYPSEFGLFSMAIQGLRFTETLPQHPKLSDENNCWLTDAVLRIRSLKVVWTEQDDAGNFPLKYEIVKIGKFTKCKLPY